MDSIHARYFVLFIASIVIFYFDKNKSNMTNIILGLANIIGCILYFV